MSSHWHQVNSSFAANGGDKQNSWWVGGTDMHHEGGWVWMSGAPWGYENWGPDEPNQNGNEDCTALDSQADSYGVSCKL